MLLEMIIVSSLLKHLKGSLSWYLVLTNRSRKPFTFNIETGTAKIFKGYRYTPSKRNMSLGSQSGKTLKPTLPDLSIEFWIEK
jgi:hypothetical protein